MEIGAFSVQEPLPQLQEPHALAMLRPWIDVGGVGAMALTEMESTLHAEPLAQLTKPGTFFDFTRYRPTSSFKDGQRHVEIPNTSLRYAIRPEGSHFLFMHLLEPHANSEEYVDSVLQMLDRFSAKRYVLLGAMYDMVPHTRPLLISGTSSNPEVQQKLVKYGVRTSNYEGPTTILTLLPQAAAQRGMETLSLLVRLPQYAPLEDDYAGKLRLLEVLAGIYDLPLDLSEAQQKAEEQRRQISTAVEGNPQLKRALTHLEERYDARHPAIEAPEDPTPLPRAIEDFLRELGS